LEVEEVIPSTVIEIKQEGSGVVLAEDADFSAWTDGDSLAVENTAEASPDGGDIKINAGEVNETLLSYSGVNPTTQRLIGVTVTSGGAQHGAGTVGIFGSATGSEAETADYLEKLATVMVDGDPAQVLSDVPVSPLADTYLRNGSRTSALAETVGLVVDSDDSDPYIGVPPLGARPMVGSDIGTLNPDAVTPIAEDVAVGVVEDNVTPIGLGDGAAPDDPIAAPTIVRTPKVNVVDMRGYTVPGDWIAFEVRRSTNGGSSWTTLGQSGSLYVDNNIAYGTTYTYGFRVYDSEGNVTAWSPNSSSVQPVQAGTADLEALSVTATILAATITLSTLFRTAASGSRVEFDGSGIRLINGSGVTTANLNPSTGVATLYGAVFRTSLTGSGSRVEIDSSGLRFYDSGGTLILNLNASTGNISLKGSITSGSDISGATIEGGTVRSSTGTTYVTLSSALGAAVDFYVSGTRKGRITAGSGGLSIGDSALVGVIEITPNTVEIPSAAQLNVTGALLVGTDSTPIGGGDVPSGYFILYKSGNSVMAKANGRAAVTAFAL
jgi:hypothetical protein